MNLVWIRRAEVDDHLDVKYSIFQIEDEIRGLYNKKTACT